jgi:hypothetical protein
MGATVNASSDLPELGPALGRLVHPPAARGVDRLLAPARLSLVTELLAAAGSAREALADGDGTAAQEALSLAAWARLWDAAAEDAAELVRRRLDERIMAAAATARMPARMIERRRVTPVEHRAIHARLGASAGAMLRAAAELEDTAGPAWSEQVLATARRLESAWAGLTAAAERELAEWEPDIQAVEAWRRAQWPLWAVTAMVAGVALWVGLVLGGYLPVPAALLPAAEFLWGHM